MITRSCLLAYCFLFTSSLAGQSFFTAGIGGAADDEAVTVREAFDGGYFIAGTTRSQGAGGADVYLARVDRRGEILWEKQYGGEKDDFGWGMRLARNGDVIITGFSESVGAGGDDVYVIRTDSLGNLKWLKAFGGKYNDRSWDVIEAQDGSLIVAAEYGVTDEPRNIDGWLLRLSAEGIERSSIQFGGPHVDRCFSVILEPDGGYVLSGFTNSKGAGEYDVYLVKVDAEGRLLWEKTYGGGGFEVGHTVRHHTKGFLVVGYSRSGQVDGKADGYVVLVDRQGVVITEKMFGGPLEERTLTVVESEKGGYYVLGYAEQTATNWDAYVAELDKDFQLVQTGLLGDMYLDTGGHNLLREGKDLVFVGYINRTGSNKDIYIYKGDLGSMRLARTSEPGSK